MEVKMKQKWTERILKFKGWLLSIPFLGIALWYLIKIIICLFFGICII